MLLRHSTTCALIYFLLVLSDETSEQRTAKPVLDAYYHDP